jgi:hypothetical protein
LVGLIGGRFLRMGSNHDYRVVQSTTGLITVTMVEFSDESCTVGKLTLLSIRLRYNIFLFAFIGNAALCVVRLVLRLLS